MTEPLWQRVIRWVHGHYKAVGSAIGALVAVVGSATADRILDVNEIGAIAVAAAGVLVAAGITWVFPKNEEI